ncbi:lipopolysaccharide export system protein LptC [Bisgaardia hudsonensis]|uniref:Lipopolysaccharide export system protein LptC n=1 Tax=Bisgaardia hudsonensis TaxID=109472 RepID=A0A4R2N054_9PAST|nr:LPS export ABC transporter periplasmic protein LptC [Bisgaardia hudsonensis]QLB13344.1 LPS export ABC transporter periplasmic protein LptC [Bisgaardia hudsonensis]TCP12745.1 lipopolysaccharide export system protein LptC [Bisgaardia hudsonensis]
MNLRWVIVLSIIAFLSFAWFYSLQASNDELTQLIKDKKSPEYIGHKMETTVFSLTGEKQYVANAKTVEYYDSEGYSIFEEPIVHLFDIKNKQFEQQNWKLSAKQAKLTKDNMLYLEGEVIAQNLVNNSKLQQITAEEATINLKNQDITSNTTVNIIGQNIVSTGSKLVGNLNQQIATLKEQVKTRYEISNK